MLTALALAGAALLAVLAAVALLRPRPKRPRAARRETLSRRFNFDRYKQYENK